MTQDITADDFCWGCMQNEPFPEGVRPFRICGECNHLFVTAQDLIDEDVVIRREGLAFGYYDSLEPRTPEEIFSCPICMHDF